MAKDKIIRKGWAILGDIGLIHYLVDEEMRFYTTKRAAERELKLSNKYGKVVRIQITILKGRNKKNKKR